MTTNDLARSYLEKARVRLAVLDLLMERAAYSDLVREAQETVELALKGMLRFVGVDPPRLHDMGPTLSQYRDRFPNGLQERVDRLVRISGDLRQEREKAFYGDVDFIPTDQYQAEHGERAREGARFVVAAAEELMRARIPEEGSQ